MSYLPQDRAFTTDITFCDNTDCPFKDCVRHAENMRKLEPHTIVSVASLGGVCRKYIGWLVLDIEDAKMQEMRKEVENQLG